MVIIEEFKRRQDEERRKKEPPEAMSGFELNVQSTARVGSGKLEGSIGHFRGPRKYLEQQTRLTIAFSGGQVYVIGQAGS